MIPAGGSEDSDTQGGSSAAAWPVGSRRIVELGWLSVAVCVPLAVNPWGHDPFTPIKVALLRAAVWTMVVVWALDAIRNPREPVGWRSPLAPAAAVLAVVVVAATLLAVNPRLSLWGSAARGQGMLTLLSYLGLGVLVAANLRSEAAVRRLLAAIACTAVPMAVIGAVQAAGFSGDLVSDARSPVMATLGRSNFLGTYLAMVLPLTLVWTSAAARLRWRVAAGLLAVVEMALLLLTQVRAAWLAAAVGAAVLLVAARSDRLRLWWARPGVRAFLAVVGVGALAGGLTVARAGGSGAARLSIWQGCARLLFERPLFGFGPDALELVFPRFYPADLVYHQGRWAFVDRAHSWPLDLAISIGLAGLAAFLAVLLVALATAWRPLLRSDLSPAHRLLLAAAVAGVAAHLTANLLSFDVTETATLLWLLLGILAAAGRWTAADEPSRTQGHGGSPLTPAAIVVAVLLAGLILVFNGRQVVADVRVRRAELAAAAGDPETALQASRKAIAAWPREAEWYRLHAELQAAQLRSSGRPDLTWLEAADATLAQAVELQPQRFDLWLIRGRIATEAAVLGEEAAAGAADSFFSEAARLAPQHAYVLHDWARLDWAMGRLDVAESKLRKAVDLDITSVAAWADLGQLQLQRGRLDESAHSFNNALALDPGWLPAWLGSAVLHHRVGDDVAARNALETARRLAPEHPEVARLEQLLDPREP
jgi:putative inorganic carbon (HCO3(-)) transporter